MLRRGPPPLAAIAQEVQALVDKGELDDARRALARGREASRALRIDASRYEAAVLAFRKALKEFTPEAVPYWHPIAQENLDRANALLAQRRNE